MQIIGIVLFVILSASYGFGFSDYEAATVVLGQTDFTTNNYPASPSQSNFISANSVAIDPVSGKLFVSDRASSGPVNNRVLRFGSALSLANGDSAEAVLGQTNFTSSGDAVTQSGIDRPYGVFVDSSGNLWMADRCNARVLRFDNAAAKADGANADGVLGQANFTSDGIATTQSGMNTPISVLVDGSGNLYVHDLNHSRVLIFNNAAGLADGANASNVLGAPDFTTASWSTTAQELGPPNGDQEWLMTIPMACSG